VGIPLALQTRYLQQAAYLAFRQPRVSGLSFYQWDDEPVVDRGSGTKRYSGWQTGLRFDSGRPKPALSTMPAPFVIDLRRGLLWGHVRPDAEPDVEVLIRPRGERGFRPLTTVRMRPDGIWTQRMALTPGAAYRYRWRPPGARSQLSGIVDLARRERSPYRASLAR
jgi:hypothetical protein